MPEAVLEAVDVSKDFVLRNRLSDFVRPRRRTVLSHVNLTLKPGEVVGLRGPNGAGKTTLLRILAGLLVPNAGRVNLLGGPLAEADLAARARIGSVLADTQGFYWRLSCRENLMFYARLWGLNETDARQHVEQAASWLGLADRLDDYFMTLSSGLMRRLSLARSLLVEPLAWLLDEPTRELDEATRDWLREEIIRRTGQGCAVLFISHEKQELEAVSTRIVTLEEGSEM